MKRTVKKSTLVSWATWIPLSTLFLSWSFARAPSSTQTEVHYNTTYYYSDSLEERRLKGPTLALLLWTSVFKSLCPGTCLGGQLQHFNTGAFWLAASRIFLLSLDCCLPSTASTIGLLCEGCFCVGLHSIVAGEKEDRSMQKKQAMT